MVQLTERDERMIDWLAIVRVAEYDAIQWALPALSGQTFPVTPVHRRLAQHWVWRMREIGLVDHARPFHSTGTIIWPTHRAVGRAAPNLFRHTTLHEVLVAHTSALYLAHGYSWQRDRQARGLGDHQADGIATRDGRTELVEVELSTKTTRRYGTILNSHSERLGVEGVSRVVYVCTPKTAAAVTREADRLMFRDRREQLRVVRAVDERGHWIGSQEDEAWLIQ